MGSSLTSRATMTRRAWKGAWATLVSVVLVASGLVASSGPATAQAPVATAGVASASTADMGIVKTADLTKFRPGNIISDAVFFNSATMSEAQIQSFLESKVSSCRSGFTCLKDYYVQTRSIAADAMCSAYSGGGMERASRVIYKVAQACGINPQVILVMLQKEQGLITSTAPSSWAYQAAMGQGCPDTAACDTRYYGLFNQIHGGAWQLKRYANPPGTSQLFTWYAPGKTWNILYNPNAACGRAPVLVENQATANLYYYTPYQPNSAALAAGYGLGDGCSSYGNRNFFNYFTDWFGSTQSSISGLYIVGGTVWLVTGTSKYAVGSDVLAEYKAALGNPRSMSAGALAAFSDAGRASLYLYSESADEKSLLQGGEKHRFASCSQMAQWGGDCASVTRLDSTVYRAITTGGAVSDFARTVAGGRMYQITGATMWRVYNMQHLIALAGGKMPFIGIMPAAAAEGFKFPERIRFAPGLPIQQEGSSTLLLATLTGKLLTLPSGAQASELGLPSKASATVASSHLDKFERTGSLGSFVTCGDSPYFAASGSLRLLTSGTPDGFASVRLEDATCAELTIAPSSISGPVFVRASGSSKVYRALGGSYRWIPEGARRAQEMNGNKVATINVIGPAMEARLVKGETYARSGQSVVVDGVAGQFFVDGARLIPVNSATIGAAGLSAPTRVSPASVAGLSTRDEPLGHFIRCNGKLYSAGDAAWSHVQSGDSAGNGVSTLASTTCATLKYGASIAGAVFVTDGEHYALASSGGFLDLSGLGEVSRAAAGQPIRIKRVGPWYFAHLPRTAVPLSGEVVTVYEGGEVVPVRGNTAESVVDGAGRISLAHAGARVDLGLPESRAVTAQVVLGLPLQGRMGIFVRCGGVDYVAGQGTLYRLTGDAGRGFTTVALTDATCATLTVGSTATSGVLFFRDVSTSAVYVADGTGKARALTATESPRSLNGGVDPVIVPVSPDTISVIRY